MGGRNAGQRFNGGSVPDIASHYSERCEKWAYASRRDAKVAARRASGAHLRPYECAQCRDWHLHTLPDQVLRGEHTAQEHFGRFESDPRLRLPRERIASSRHTAARQLRYDSDMLAAAYADHTAGTDRASPAWAGARARAGELLGWLQNQYEQLARDAAGAGFANRKS